jgi:hypothetical protein
MLSYGLSDLLLLVVGSLVVFVLREYILKVHVLVSSEHKLCQIWKNLYRVLYILINCFFKQIIDIFFNKDYYQESNILIIAYNNMVTVVEWLDGSFESQSRL